MLLRTGISCYQETCLAAQQEVIEPTRNTNANSHSKKIRTFMGEKDKAKILQEIKEEFET
ncbi:hypothetical protein RHMOL_Rhmol04G0290400 [Rhododendron molle]|uniref:Uncharacterized protein n=1 Tax=Rhododendron molle TaxID=49168 RepID=A0ACC0P5X6_RHOML|nr:hypothetical protein RHMOL_Rhmol04G0290400 [Rhododendron molle]